MVEHNPAWKDIFEAEKKQILEILERDSILRIEHFGSTAIPAIKAKPYIDIIIEIPKELLFDEGIIEKLGTIGYTHFKVPEREGIDAYMSFGKGYNLEGMKEQIYHIHMCPKENIMWDQIDFRDYLRSNNERARAYEDLKLRLALEFKNDRGAYVLGKTEFIKEAVKAIKKERAPNM